MVSLKTDRVDCRIPESSLSYRGHCDRQRDCSNASRSPADCSLDDVLYHLYVLQAAGQGAADGEVNRVIPHDQVAADLRREWLLGSVK